nr:hypothetical protein B0A51_02797 [Rachicladosporium sp. CCFEE 5018]
MPASSSRPASRNSNDGNVIGKLDYHPGGRSLLHANGNEDTSQAPSYAGSFFEQIAEGVVNDDLQRKTRQATRYFSFAWAIINCLCAGGITAYSLYAPLFQKRLHYTQLQVNGVSITAELAMYLPVPLFGFMCDRYGPGPPSLLAGGLFGIGYFLAAFAYKAGPPPSAGGDGWPYAIMVLAFIPIGMATSCMYLSAVTTCAKNFGRGKYKGIALAIPIAAFGLSGMWQSQIGSNLLYEPLPDGGKGDVDVHRFFLFLGGLFVGVGVIGAFALRIVDEEELIDEAIDELERSGLLTENEFFHRAIQDTYGTLPRDRRLSTTSFESLNRKASEHAAQAADEQYQKKTWLLNEETRRFLGDHTMWWLAAGFFLVTGPGEAFINNLGTIIDTLYTPDTLPAGGNPTSAATHVSIVAITSTLARILTGTLTDLLAPTAPPHQHRRGPHSLENSMASVPPLTPSPPRKLELSRMTFLLIFALLCSLGQILLASGLIQSHASRFWAVSALIGSGYGATFSLVPIIISVVWGVENFGTNWGIVATVPAAGATVWGLAYSDVYQRGAEAGGELCYGVGCYGVTFWAMAGSVWVACGLWGWAWRGRDGWVARGVLV